LRPRHAATASRLLRCATPAVLLILTACAATDPLPVMAVPLIDPTAIAQAVGAADNDDAGSPRVEIGRDATRSLHAWAVRGAASRRLHRRHDLLLVVHRGEGRLLLDQRLHTLIPGDVFVVPRITGYAVESTSDQPLVCLLVFTPPYAGQDTLPWPVGATSYPREAELP